MGFIQRSMNAFFVLIVGFSLLVLLGFLYLFSGISNMFYYVLALVIVVIVYALYPSRRRH